MPNKDQVAQKIINLNELYGPDIVLSAAREVAEPKVNRGFYCFLDDIEYILDEIRAATEVHQLQTAVSKLYIVAHTLNNKLNPLPDGSRPGYYSLPTKGKEREYNSLHRQYSSVGACDAKNS